MDKVAHFGEANASIRTLHPAFSRDEVPQSVGGVNRIRFKMRSRRSGYVLEQETGRETCTFLNPFLPMDPNSIWGYMRKMTALAVCRTAEGVCLVVDSLRGRRHASSYEWVPGNKLFHWDGQFCSVVGDESVVWAAEMVYRWQAPTKLDLRVETTAISIADVANRIWRHFPTDESKTTRQGATLVCCTAEEVVFRRFEVANNDTAANQPAIELEIGEAKVLYGGARRGCVCPTVLSEAVDTLILQIQNEDALARKRDDKSALPYDLPEKNWCALTAARGAPVVIRMPFTCIQDFVDSYLTK